MSRFTPPFKYRVEIWWLHIQVYILGTNTLPSVLHDFYLFVCSPFSGQISTSAWCYTSLRTPHLLARTCPLLLLKDTGMLSVCSAAKPRFSSTPQWLKLWMKASQVHLEEWSQLYSLTYGLSHFCQVPQIARNIQTNGSYKGKESDIFVYPLIFLAFWWLVTAQPVRLASVSKSQWLSCFKFVRILGEWRATKSFDNRNDNNMQHLAVFLTNYRHQPVYQQWVKVQSYIDSQWQSQHPVPGWALLGACS